MNTAGGAKEMLNRKWFVAAATAAALFIAGATVEQQQPAAVADETTPISETKPDANATESVDAPTDLADANAQSAPVDEPEDLPAELNDELNDEPLAGSAGSESAEAMSADTRYLNRGVFYVSDSRRIGVIIGLVMIPVIGIPLIAWLITQIPGVPTPALPVPGKPGLPELKPPAEPGESQSEVPSSPQAEQPVTPIAQETTHSQARPGDLRPAPTGGVREKVQSVPSGATEKSDRVATFID